VPFRDLRSLEAVCRLRASVLRTHVCFGPAVNKSRVVHMCNSPRACAGGTFAANIGLAGLTDLPSDASLCPSVVVDLSGGVAAAHTPCKVSAEWQIQPDLTATKFSGVWCADRSTCTRKPVYHQRIPIKYFTPARECSGRRKAILVRSKGRLRELQKDNHITQVLLGLHTRHPAGV
jgi:hypothetical protein